MKSWSRSSNTTFYLFISPWLIGFVLLTVAPLAYAFVDAIRAEGQRPAFKLKTGTADLNVVGPVWQCPIVAYGPGDSSLDHTPEEHVEIGEFERSVRILTRVIEKLTTERD